MKKYGLLINGDLVFTDDNIPVYDKYSNKISAYVARASRKEITKAVTVAENTFKKNELTPYQRFEILKKASDILNNRTEEAASIIVQDVGKPIKEARLEVGRAVQTLLLSAEEAKRIGGEVLPLSATPGAENRMGFTIRVPVGVICAITPFNFPLNLAAHKVGPAIASGNTIVLKPATTTPQIAFILSEILSQAGLPPGHLNIITGSGGEVGDWLLEDKRIRKYTFTGSMKVGEYLKQKSGLRKLSLELGNNSPTIVHKDANLLAASQLIAQRGFANSGQSCVAVQRVYVHNSVLDEFTEKIKELTEKLNMGNPYNENTDIGPMIDEREAIRTEEWVNEAVKQGAKIITGGNRDGAYYSPTILADVNESMKVVCEEVFAPVITITPYEEIDDAITKCNNTEHGLQAGIFTESLNIAMKAARNINMGGVIVNDASTFRADAMPYGGVKNSGIGREGPKYAIEEMTELRTVVLNLEK